MIRQLDERKRENLSLKNNESCNNNNNTTNKNEKTNHSNNTNCNTKKKTTTNFHQTCLLFANLDKFSRKLVSNFSGHSIIETTSATIPNCISPNIATTTRAKNTPSSNCSRFWHGNRTQVSIKADRQIKEYFYHCIRNIDYPMRINYCWNFSSSHEQFFRRTLADRTVKRIQNLRTSLNEFKSFKNFFIRRPKLIVTSSSAQNKNEADIIQPSTTLQQSQNHKKHPKNTRHRQHYHFNSFLVVFKFKMTFK